MKADIRTDDPAHTDASSPGAAPTARPALIASRAPDLRVMRFFNPVMRALLRSPFHRLLSRRILLLTYTGRRSGRQYTLPVGYIRDGDALLVVSQHSELKRWWRNLRGGAPVAVLLRGQWLSARADVIDDRMAVAANIKRLIERLGAKEASRQLYMSLEVASGLTREQLAQSVHGIVVVRVTPERAALDVGVQRKTEAEGVEQGYVTDELSACTGVKLAVQESSASDRARPAASRPGWRTVHAR